MLFSSLTFLYFFLPIVLILYFVINNRTWHNAVLLVSSLVFYSWGEPKYVFLMLASTLVAWLCGLGIDRFKEKRRISRAFLIRTRKRYSRNRNKPRRISAERTRKEVENRRQKVCESLLHRRVFGNGARTVRHAYRRDDI